MPKMKTLTIGGVTFEVSDPEAVCFTEQELAEVKKSQARKNIGVDGGALDAFLGNIDVQYYRDEEASTNYSVIRIFKQKPDGTKQYPFVRALNGGIENVATAYDVALSEGWLLTINCACGFDVVVENGVSITENRLSDYHVGAMPLTIDGDGNLGYAAADTSASELISQGAVSAIVGFCPIIIDYENAELPQVTNAEHFTEGAQRQIIGQYSNGDYVIITGEGRGFANSVGWTIAQAQNICKKHGLKFAYNLDGGGSTETVIGLKQLNTVYEGTTGRLRGQFIVFNGYAKFDHTQEDNGLPANYTRLLYVESDKRQYINTGIPASSDFSAKYKVSSGDTGHVLSNESYYYPKFATWDGVRSVVVNRYGTEYHEPFEFSYVKDAAYEIDWDAKSGTVAVDGNTIITGASAGTVTPTGNLYMFTYGSAPTTERHMFDGRLYYLQLFDKGTGAMLYDFVPCRNPDGIVGLYDTVNKKFYHSDTGVELIGR